MRDNREAFLPSLQRLQEKLMETTLGKQRWREIARYRTEHSPGGAQLSREEFIAHQVQLVVYLMYARSLITSRLLNRMWGVNQEDMILYVRSNSRNRKPPKRSLKAFSGLSILMIGLFS